MDVIDEAARNSRIVWSDVNIFGLIQYELLVVQGVQPQTQDNLLCFERLRLQRHLWRMPHDCLWKVKYTCIDVLISARLGPTRSWLGSTGLFVPSAAYGACSHCEWRCSCSWLLRAIASFCI